MKFYVEGCAGLAIVVTTMAVVEVVKLISRNGKGVSNFSLFQLAKLCRPSVG